VRKLHPEKMNRILSIVLTRIFIFISVLTLFSSCSPELETDTEYTLVWSEEFDGNELNTDTWIHWNGPAYNDELQYYTDRPENSYVEEGILHLVAHRESFGGKEYTSARISTDSTSIGWQYGRFEARIRMPEGKGFWPAFWLMPMRDDGWPRGGEIDIMEFRGNEPYTTSAAVHFWTDGCNVTPWECREYISETHTVDETKLSESFNVYAVEWNETGLHWFLNDTEYLHVPFSEINARFEPFTTPFYIILNLAVGGNFLPNPDEFTEFPQSLEVDYVRVYKSSENVSTF
jgi:beta-glucanase (GH16 family)